MTSQVTPQLEPPVPLSTEQQKQIVTAEQPWSDQRALNTVRQDFLRAETYRIQNYDRSLRRNDDVYYAVTKVKTWEGTRIPRASIPIWMAVRHIQAIHGHVMQALFADEKPFECSPYPGTTMLQAMQVRDVMLAYMQNCNPDLIGMTAREVISRSVYSGLTYGCGPIEIGWLMKEQTRQVYTRSAIPETVIMRHPITGQQIPVRSGQLRLQVQRGTKTYRVSAPKLQNHLVYDFYIDPNCPSSNVQEAGYCAVRQLLPIGYLKQVCLPELGFRLPADDNAWAALATSYKQTMAEVSASWGELNRGNYYNRAYEQTTDAANQRVEVIRYWNNERYVWLLGRNFLAYNETNDLGIKPFVNNYYIPAPGRFYSISIPDVLEGEQKLTQTITEARLDELSLAIHSPIVKKLGVKISASQRRIAPGREWEVEDPKNDVIKMEWPNVTQQSYVEAQAAEMRGQQTTGANDVSAMGTGTTGGNSANRTATGVNTQNAAFSTRIQGLVENCEDQALEPMLQMLFLMAKKYGDPNQPMFQGSSLDPLDVLNAEVKFKFKAADKLRIRRAAASGGLEVIMQSLPALAAQLNVTGETANWDLIGRLIGDSLGIPSNDFIVPMTPQQQQVMMQQRMAPEMMKEQLQNQRMAALLQIQDSKGDTQLIDSIIKKLLTPEAGAALLDQNGIPDVMDLLKAKMAPKQLPAGDKKAS